MARQWQEDFDITKYLGTWYEIARTPNYFERNCVANARAQYKLVPEQACTFTVENSCLYEGDVDHSVLGLATYDPINQAKLSVTFVPRWLRWLPVVWGGLWVYLAVLNDTQTHYYYAVAGSPTTSMAWILSRDPQFATSSYYEICVSKLRELNYPVDKLIVCPQRWPTSSHTTPSVHQTSSSSNLQSTTDVDTAQVAGEL
uniref:Putative lipocalin R877 n=1 Tax=Lygus hesperus TaxID=30085 RepID=A0A0A9ZEB1_LYGHE